MQRQDPVSRGLPYLARVFRFPLKSMDFPELYRFPQNPQDFTEIHSDENWNTGRGGEVWRLDLKQVEVKAHHQVRYLTKD